MRLAEYVVHREIGKAPLLGCLSSRRFLEVDEDTIVAVGHLARGETIEQTEAALLARTGEESDVLGLAAILFDRGFIETIDEEEAGFKAPSRGLPLFGFLNRIPADRARWIRSPLLWTIWGSLLAGWIALLILVPELRPGFGDVIISTHASLQIVILIVCTLGITSLHESAHFLMARSYGVSAKTTISQRFFLPVFQTDVTNAWLLKARQRVLIFLAGMALNLFLITTATFILLAAMIERAPESWLSFLRFFIYLNIIPLAFQLFLFGRTDLYFVLQVALGERNLAADARSLLTVKTKKLLARARSLPRHKSLSCEHSVWSFEPFCVRCGKPTGESGATYYTYEYGSRRKLGTFAGVLVLGHAVSLLYVFGVIYRGLIGYLFVVSREIIASVETRTYTPVWLLDAASVLAFITLQLAFAVYFLWQFARNPGRSFGAWAKKRAAPIWSRVAAQAARMRWHAKGTSEEEAK